MADYFNPLVVEGISEILTDYNEWPEGFTIDDLIGVYSSVSRILNENQDPH